MSTTPNHARPNAACNGSLRPGLTGGFLRSIKCPGYSQIQRLPPACARRATVSLEDHLQRFATGLQSADDGQWDAGRAVAEALRDSASHAPDKRAAKGLRRALLGQFAAVGHCSRERVRQLAEVWVSFRELDRAADRSWTWHRHVLGAARRSNRELAAVLADAVTSSLGLRQLRELGNGAGGPEEIRLDATCGECGARVHVSLRGAGIRQAWRGLPIPCPFCIGRAEHDLGNGILDALGTLR